MATIQGIYVALFGRPADPAGLAFFNEATNNGADLTAIGDLASTSEYLSRFTGMTNEQIINSIYQSLFERDGEAAGIDFFVGELEAGRLNINNIAIAILDGAQGDDLLTINAKIAAANIFTSHLDLEIESEAYRGTAAAQIGREFLDTVTKDDAGTEAEADAAILRLFPDEGQQPGGGSSGGEVSHSDEASYGSADVLLLDNSSIKGQYSYNPESEDPIGELGQAVYSAMQDAYNEDGSLNGNTILINNLDPVVDLIEPQLGTVTDVISQLLPSYEEWTPDTLFFGIPGQASTVKGTSGNDVAVFLGGDHTFTGGRGNDVIITADVSGLIPVSLPFPVSNEISTFDAEVTPAKHTVDGGAGSDIIINVGGNENVLKGGAGQDLIVSIGDATDTINGGDGDDFIFGGSDNGNAVIYQKVSSNEVSALIGPAFVEPDFSKGDTLTGGNGKDTFLFLPEGQIADEDTGLEFTPLGNIVSNGADTITDFQTGTDKIGIFVVGPSTIGYGEGTGFVDYDAAASAAWESFNPSIVEEVESSEDVDIRVFFAAGVDGSGYLFVDDNVDGCADFVIKLDGLTDVDDLSAADIEAIDVANILETIGGIVGSSNPLMTDFA